MTRRQQPQRVDPTGAAVSRPWYLGIEGGATRTVALLANAAGQLVQRIEAGPGNLRLLDDTQLLRLFRRLGRGLPAPAALGAGLAGARTERDRQRIRAAAARVWPRTPCYATHDLETALTAAKTVGTFRPAARILVLCGTGSCCYGQAANGRVAKVGGWGHLLGDRGSAYEIGLRALQHVVAIYDCSGRWPALGERILAAGQLNQPEDLVQWVQEAPKNEVAALATAVFARARQGDRLARNILDRAATVLASDAAACAGRLAAKGKPVLFILAGGVLQHQAPFARQVAVRIRRLWPANRVVALDREGAWGAVELARRHFAPPPGAGEKQVVAALADDLRQHRPSTGVGLAVGGEKPTWELSPTEQRHPRSMNLDRMRLSDAIRLMLSEDARISRGVLAKRLAIEQAVRRIVGAFRRGGRLFYVGAGTSGRLGVLDASECPPTFSTPPEQVQGIIAGGYRALWQSIEGAEDDREAGAEAIQFRGVGRKDVVVGIAASGQTPFVGGALVAAKRRGAVTILLTFNPRFQPPVADRPTLVIAPDVGPELLTGSTRLKAGTATKVILNLFTTLAMVRLGKVVSNLMVDLNPTNRKLRDRAVRILCQLTGLDALVARAALERAGWIVKKAWAAWKRGCSRTR